MEGSVDALVAEDLRGQVFALLEEIREAVGHDDKACKFHAASSEGGQLDHLLDLLDAGASEDKKCWREP